jgi:hypothetical protein
MARSGREGATVELDQLDQLTGLDHVTPLVRLAG